MLGGHLVCVEQRDSKVEFGTRSSTTKGLCVATYDTHAARVDCPVLGL